VRTLPSAATTHFGEEVTTLAVCWRVERPDGELILGTEHDRDLEITGTVGTYDLTGTYLAGAGITGSDVKSTADMSVDNMEVNGALKGDLTVVDLSAADIESGLFDGSSVILFMVNWAAPNDFQVLLKVGTIGNIRRTAEGQYTTELRGLTQALTKNLVRTYGAYCDAELGDARCKVDVSALTSTGTVTAVTSNRLVEVSVSTDSTTGEPGYYTGGLVTWVTGDNAGFKMEAKRAVFDVTVSTLELYLPMAATIQVGDTFTIQPGCDKTAAMCKGRFGNLVNYRGHGTWCPGQGALGVFGGQTPGYTATPSSDLLKWPRDEA
jgi:uncharacterized phage protein (TIGR02218 family)